ncbi:hypothetical protein F4859DRAFT_131092 [Xylaria cf. heliscus]|nr:hypothetical protein F4859DRAFT_131092 [Xylaria cf. heliscus]
MGTHDYLRRMKEDAHANYYRSDVDTASSGLSTPHALPRADELFQQVLVLILCTGELVFLIMDPTPAGGGWKFVSSRFPVFGIGGKLVDPGFHMTISPDGGYLTLACSENILIVYRLRSIAELHCQHTEGQPIQPIITVKARAVKGVVHKIEFLHPSSENPYHVVLLVITVQSGVIRLVVYEWETQESLQDVLNVEKSGHRLDETAGLPVLVIPLTISYQFLIITENSMAICSDVLSGPPVFVPFQLAHRDKSEWHHGTHDPMWTAWSRPLREESYHTAADLIYLAREDGWINSLEVSSDSDIDVSIYLGPLECNIDSGFATLSTPHGEVLLAGGDYGFGAIWHLNPRENPERVGLLPNWSPTVDLALKTHGSERYKSDHKKLSKRPLPAEKPQGHLLAPENIFVCSGRDKSGAIVELRYGIQAKIGLDLLYPSPIKRCWAIPSFDGAPEEAGFLMLLALSENSALLHISQDLSEVSEKAQEAVDFDLLSTTLAVYVSEDFVVQITVAHATILFPTSCYQHSISDMIEDPSATIIDSALTGEILALSVYSHSIFKIMVFTFDKTRFVLTHTIDEPDGDITAISLDTLSLGVCVLAGISYKESSTLVIVPLDQSNPGMQTLSDTRRESITVGIQGGEGSDSPGIHAVTSIACLGDGKIVVGKRDGDVLTMQLLDNHQTERGLKASRTNHFGVSSSRVFTGMIFDTGPSTFVCNDAGLAIMKEPDGRSDIGCFEEISRIWLTDANEPHSPSPTINSVSRLHQILGYGDSTWAMVSESRILITELQSYPGPVPRYMPIEGTPLEILYSKRLDALVTVVKKNGIPSLHFFDPVTGGDLSHPIKKVSDQDDEKQVDVDYIIPLGSPNIKIVSLMSWRYKNKGDLHEWFVILARLGDDQGRLLVVSAEQEVAATTTGRPRQIRFRTQFHRKIKDGLPRCGTTDDDGLFLNFGKTVEYHIIEDKKFKTAMKYNLPSPATSLEVIDGHLHILTTHHSLLILDYKSDDALNSERMIELHTDKVARNGLHSIDVGSLVNIKERQKLILVSDPMCGVYGLWCSDKNPDNSSFQLIFRADLTVSIRKFISGYTRPRWARDKPRYEIKQIYSDRRAIVGLAIDGSLVQFSILHEDTWRLLRYIQNLAMALEDFCHLSNDHDSTESTNLEPTSLAKIKMHVDGDILQQCLDKRMLERVVSTPQQLVRLQGLLLPLGVISDVARQDMLNETSLAYQQTYSILEYYLSPAL